MECKFASEVVMDKGTKLGSLRVSPKVYRYYDTQAILYPVGKTIPLIQTREGCLGMAYIVSMAIELNDSSDGFVSSVCFEVVNVGKDISKFLYANYQNNLIASENNTQESDTFIPGMMGAMTRIDAPTNGYENLNRPARDNEAFEPILDYSDEYDDDGYYDGTPNYFSGR